MHTPASTFDRNLPGFLQDQGLSRHLVDNGTDASNAQPIAGTEDGGPERVVDDGEAFDAADLADILQESPERVADASDALVNAPYGVIHKNPLTSLGGAFVLGWMLASLTR